MSGAPGTSLLIFGLQMAATMVCAVGGALAAGRKRLDMVGVVFVSFVAAVGGGSLRDLLLDRNPVFWLAQPSYLTVSLAAGALTWIYICRWRAPVRFLSFVDAFGLALFTISGIQIAQETGQSVPICLVMGVITGVAGGLFRDLLCGEIPSIFKSGELYASASLLGGAAPTSATAFCMACTIRAVESNRVPSQSKAKRAIGWALWMMLGCMVG